MVRVNVNVNVFVNVVVLTCIAETDEFVFTPNLMSRFYREYIFISLGSTIMNISEAEGHARSCIVVELVPLSPLSPRA